MSGAAPAMRGLACTRVGPSASSSPSAACARAAIKSAAVSPPGPISLTGESLPARRSTTSVTAVPSRAAGSPERLETPMTPLDHELDRRSTSPCESTSRTESTREQSGRRLDR